jgi:hypothetical protein
LVIDSGEDPSPPGEQRIVGERLRRLFRSLPALTRMGIVVLGTGVVVDVGAHLLGPGPAAMSRCCGPAFLGHLVTLAGMLLAVAGALTLAVRRRSRPTPREGRS